MGKPKFTKKSMKRYKQGYYNPSNVEKYIGNPSDIQFRSGLEQRFCYFCDHSPKVRRWGSEIVKIPYKGVDNKMHTYYTDYYVEFEDSYSDTGTSYWIIEVKSSSEVLSEPPEIPKNESRKALKSYKYQIETWMKNMAKWKAAKAFCESRGWIFKIITEQDIGKLISSMR